MSKIGEVVAKSSKGQSFEPVAPEPGPDLGLLLHVIDLGVHVNTYATDEYLESERVKLSKAGKTESQIDFILNKVKFKRKVKLVWELPNQLMPSGPKKGQPLVISEDVNAVLTDKESTKASTLRKRINALAGKVTDGSVNFRDFVGKAAVLTIMNIPYKDKRGFNKIKSRITEVGSILKGTTVPDLVNKSIVLENVNDDSQETQDILAEIADSNMKWVLDRMNRTVDSKVDF